MSPPRDLLGRLIQETTPQGALGYDYDPLSNLTTLTLPTGQHLNHLHQLNLDGQLISDVERDDLHREVYRTQGTLTSSATVFCPPTQPRRATDQRR